MQPVQQAAQRTSEHFAKEIDLQKSGGGSIPPLSVHTQDNIAAAGNTDSVVGATPEGTSGLQGRESSVVSQREGGSAIAGPDEDDLVVGGAEPASPVPPPEAFSPSPGRAGSVISEAPSPDKVISGQMDIHLRN